MYPYQKSEFLILFEAILYIFDQIYWQCQVHQELVRNPKAAAAGHNNCKPIPEIVGGSGRSHVRLGPLNEGGYGGLDVCFGSGEQGSCVEFRGGSYSSEANTKRKEDVGDSY
jgi:hypothetical protein